MGAIVTFAVLLGTLFCECQYCINLSSFETVLFNIYISFV
uniref:Uncharacterized protein n=1 Tax=Anguilla anguilla TaxID=7936 RepID=A0A0E9Y027_ANGAN